jgi:phasin
MVNAIAASKTGFPEMRLSHSFIVQCNIFVAMHNKWSILWSGIQNKRPSLMETLMAEAKSTKTAKPVKQTAQKPAKAAAAKNEAVFDDAVTAMSGSLEASEAQAPELLRTIAETSVNQAQEVYARVKTAAEDATDVMEETFENTRDGVLEAQHKALDVARDNAEATFDFAKKLLAVTSLSDAVQLQTGFVRDRFEAYIDYTKGIQTATTKLVEAASEPAKTAVARTLDEVKAA